MRRGAAIGGRRKAARVLTVEPVRRTVMRGSTVLMAETADVLPQKSVPPVDSGARSRGSVERGTGDGRVRGE